MISGGSSLYGSAEERQANEVRRLKRELGDARDQVNSLSTQLTLHVSRSFHSFTWTFLCVCKNAQKLLKFDHLPQKEWQLIEFHH